MITGGTGARHPDLRIGFSHGGGALLMALPRMNTVWESKVPGLEAALTESPMVTARRFYYDHVVQDPALLRLIVDTYGDTQILVGSDYPFYPATLVHPHADFDEAGLSAEVVARITDANPRRFLGLA